MVRLAREWWMGHVHSSILGHIIMPAALVIGFSPACLSGAALMRTPQQIKTAPVEIDGMGALTDTAPAIEHWLQHEVAATYDELKLNPAAAIPIAEVRRNLDRRRRHADAAV